MIKIEFHLKMNDKNRISYKNNRSAFYTVDEHFELQ